MSDFFEFKITKDECIKLRSLLYSLALISDLDEIQQANFLWHDIFTRNVFGYSLDFANFHEHLIRNRSLKYEKD